MSRRKEKTSLSVAFGKVVRYLRLRAGHSQEAFAAKCGIDRAYYGLIERGGHTPTIQTVWRIAEGLGGSPSELIKGVERQIEIDLGKPKKKVQYKKLFYNIDAQLRSRQVEEPSGRG